MIHENLSGLSSQPVIRVGTEADLDAILGLVYELAEYEKGLEKVSVTLETYQDAFANDYFRALVATVDGEVVGMAIYYKTFSTWKGRMMHLEDFVVKEAYRRHGIGMLLFDAFLEKAHDAKSVMCKWQVLHWNELAINFYKKYDAVFDDEWIDVKLYF
jgi:GNAT superfamily N-acetyltransferase